MHLRASIDRMAPLALATVAAGSVGAAWYLDARRRQRRMALLHRTMVDLLLNALSSDDASTYRHGRRVAHLTDSLGAEFGFHGERRATLRVASLLHDMGKIDDALFDIVHGDERLDGEERSRIERHPVESGDILKPLERFHPGLACIVESHHERWNGKGYPRGLAGERIPLEARIISVADVFDALTQQRSYKRPRTPEQALAEIRRGSGTRFDPAVVAALDRPGLQEKWNAIARAGWDAEGEGPGG
jgi:HD-GYP domain-containing protein (c-di-GMP phosphodiesterase class II)